jgi:hypothetical protein
MNFRTQKSAISMGASLHDLIHAGTEYEKTTSLSGRLGIAFHCIAVLILTTWGTVFPGPNVVSGWDTTVGIQEYSWLSPLVVWHDDAHCRMVKNVSLCYFIPETLRANA